MDECTQVALSKWGAQKIHALHLDREGGTILVGSKARLGVAVVVYGCSDYLRVLRCYFVIMEFHIAQKTSEMFEFLTSTVSFVEIINGSLFTKKLQLKVW